MHPHQGGPIEACDARTCMALQVMPALTPIHLGMLRGVIRQILVGCILRYVGSGCVQAWHLSLGTESILSYQAWPDILFHFCFICLYSPVL